MDLMPSGLSSCRRRELSNLARSPIGDPLGFETGGPLATVLTYSVASLPISDSVQGIESMSLAQTSSAEPARASVFRMRGVTGCPVM